MKNSLRKLFCFTLVFTYATTGFSQTEKDFELLAKTMLSINVKNYKKVLGSYMMSREVFDKHFKEDYKLLLGEEFEMNLHMIYAGIDQLNESYMELPEMFASRKSTGKLIYSHSYSRQLPMEEGQKIPNIQLVLVFKDSKGDVWSWDFGQALVIDNQIVVNPYGNWYQFDVVNVCNCLSGVTLISKDLIGSFKQECSVLNDLEILDGVSIICGKEWEEGIDAPYDTIDICECKEYWKEYESLMKSALEVEGFSERQNRIAEINDEFAEVLSWCKEKEDYLKSQDGFAGMDAILQECDKN